MQALTRQKELSICPNLPEHWQALAFQFIHQGVTYQFSLTQTSVTITADKDTIISSGALISLTGRTTKKKYTINKGANHNDDWIYF